jgi:hypothetical protein
MFGSAISSNHVKNMNNNPFTHHPLMNDVLCVDEERLDREVHYRFQFVAQFVNFGTDDIAVIHQHKDFLITQIPEMVTQVQRKLLSFDSSRKLLMGRIEGYTGELESDPYEIDMNSQVVLARHKIFSQVFTDFLLSKFDEDFMNKKLSKVLVKKWGNRYVDITVTHNSACYVGCQLIMQELVLKSDIRIEEKHKLLIAVNKALSIYAHLTDMSLLCQIETPQEQVVSESDESADEIEYLY